MFIYNYPMDKETMKKAIRYWNKQLKYFRITVKNGDINISPCCDEPQDPDEQHIFEIEKNYVMSPDFLDDFYSDYDDESEFIKNRDTEGFESSNVFAPKDMDSILSGDSPIYDNIPDADPLVEGSINFGHNSGNDPYPIVGLSDTDAAEAIGVEYNEENSIEITDYIEQTESEVEDFLYDINQKLEADEMFIKPGYSDGFQVMVKDKDYYEGSDDPEDSYENIRSKDDAIIKEALNELINSYGLYEYTYGWTQSKIKK